MSLSDQDALRNLLNRPDKIAKYASSLTVDDLKMIDAVLSNCEGARPRAQADAIDRQRAMATIEQAAQVNYLRMAERTAPAMMATSIIYAFAIYMVSSILVNQTSHVMDSSGISSLPNILEWWKPSRSH